LNFSECFQISEEGIGYLSDGLEKVTNLQKLSLDFSGCEKIGNKGLQRLSQSVRGLNSLQSVSLDFGGCRMITNEGFCILSEGIKELVSLFDLQLTFHGCDIDDGAIESLREGMKTLDLLKSFDLILNNCHKIKEETFAGLTKAIKKKNPLMRIKIISDVYRKLSNEGILL